MGPSTRFARRFESAAHAERVRRLPTPFQLFRYVTGSDHLHFGLYTTTEADIREAQERNTAKLLAALPRVPSSILDIGCGLGGTSVALAELGHRVLGFAPDPALIGYADALVAERGLSGVCTFLATGLYELPADTPPFDVVLSQESLQYIHPLTRAMRRIAVLTRPGGRVIIGDQTLRALEYRSAVRFHDSEGIRAAAADEGLELIHHEDVTEEAIHQAEVSLRALRESSREMIEFFRAEHPDIEHDLAVCLEMGSLEGDAYRNGWLGYEHFVWRRPKE